MKYFYPFGGLVLGVLLCTSQATAQTRIYVDTGNPNCPGSGTQADPFCTIGAGMEVALPMGAMPWWPRISG